MPPPTGRPAIARRITAPLRAGGLWLIGESSPSSKKARVVAVAVALIVVVTLLVAVVATSGSPTSSATRRVPSRHHPRPAPTAGRPATRPATPRDARVVTPPGTIADDCSRDVAPSLLAWLWSLPRGTAAQPVVVDFPRGACYSVDEALYLRGLTYVTFNGNGAEFREDAPAVTTIGPLPVDHPYCGSSFDDQSGTTMSAIPIIWWFEGGCDITLDDMYIVGPDRTGVIGSETDSGIQLSGVQRSTVEGVTEQDVDGDFVTVTGLHEGSPESGGGIAIFPSRHIVIRDNQFTRSGRQGITPQYVDGLTISGNTFSGVAFTNIDLEADEPGGCSCDVAVDHNTFVGPLAYLVAGLTGLSIQHFSFTDNSLVGGAEMKVQFAPQLPSWDIVIAGNTAQSGSTWPWPSIGIAYSVDGDGAGSVTQVQIRDNTLPAPPDGRAFVLAGAQASDVEVSANQVVGLSPTSLLVNHGAASNQTCGNSAGPNGPALDGACG